MMPRWLGWSLLALVCWGTWAILLKMIGEAISPEQIQAISTLGILPILPALALRREGVPRGRVPRGVLLALGAGLVSCLGNLPFYALLNSGAKASTVVPLTALYPLVTVLLALPLLKERLNPIQAAGIALSLAAIYLLNVQDERGILSQWLFVALLPIVLWGTAGLLQKMSTGHLSGGRCALWFHVAFVLIGAVMYFARPLTTDVPPSILTWAILSGFTLALGNLAILMAFASGGKASVITPLTGLYPLVSVPLAIMLFQEKVGGREAIGIALAITAVVALTRESPTNSQRVFEPEIPS